MWLVADCCMMDGAGVKKGDRVAVYMPMIVELVVTLLACARLGVIHSVVVSFYYLLLLVLPLTAYSVSVCLYFALQQAVPVCDILGEQDYHRVICTEQHTL